MLPIVQISLDLTNIDEALQTAEMALRAGVDWLEAGTPLLLAEGLHGVKALREQFGETPILQAHLRCHVYHLAMVGTLPMRLTNLL